MDKNYYLTQKIEDDGVAKTLNPSYIRGNSNPLVPTIPKYTVGQYFEDDSKYDKRMGSSIFDVIDGSTTVNDVRADAQSGVEQFGNALANNLVIAGTTAISNSLGLANGLISALVNWDVSKIWDNATNNYMTSLQDKTREAMPIYRGSNYENKSLFGKLGSSVFWADLVQNLGYTEGMFLPGAGVSKLVSAAPKVVRMLVPSLVSSIGEASIEAVQSKNDEVQNKTEIATQRYRELMAQAPDFETKRRLEEAYKKTLSAINEDATTAGNIVFASNVALLSATNTIEFGNLWSRGFNTQRKLRGAIRRSDDVITGGPLVPEGYKVGRGAAITELVGRKLIESGAEGMEEVSQDAIQNTPKNYSKANTFNESVFNPEKREIASGLMGAMGQGIAETFKDKNTATDFAMGFITGAIGVPTLKRGGFPIALQNNMITDIVQGIRSLNEQQTAVDEANKRLQNSPAIQSYYNGIVRHMAIQEDMNADVDNNDKAGYKEKESAQFISDIITFDNVGDLNRLEEIIENSVDTSDEGIQELIQSTSKNGEGPFMTNGTPMDINEVREKLEDKKKELIGKIQGYKRNKESLTRAYPNLTKEALEDALYLRGQIDDIGNRIGELSNSIEDKVRNYKPVRTSETEGTAPPEEYIQRAQTLFSEGKSKEAEAELRYAFRDMPVNDLDELVTEVKDLNTLVKSFDSYNKSLAEVLKAPDKATEDRNKLQEKAVKADKERKKNTLEQEIDNAKTVHDIPNIISKADNAEEALNTVLNSQNPIAREFTRIHNMDKSIQEAYNEYAGNKQELDIADALWKDHVNNSNTYKEASNFDINSFLSKEDLEKQLGTPIDDNLYNNALALLSRAITEFNHDAAITDRIPESTPQSRKPDNGLSFKDADGNPVGSAEEMFKREEERKKALEEKPTDSFQEIQERESAKDQPSEEDDYSIEQANNSANSVKDNLPEAKEGKKQYIQTDTPEVGRDSIKTKDWSTFDIRFPQYASVFNYLKEKGAFEYVNSGKLKAGDTVKFMIDPAFGEDAIFMVTEDGQVIGNIDPNKASLGDFLGLSELVEKIKEEYSNREDKESKEPFIASMQTHVSQILRGKIPVGREEQSNSLNDIPGVIVEKIGSDGNPVLDDDGNPITELSKDIKFGVMKNGVIITNSGEPINIISPADTEHKEGRVYLLVKNSTGEYNAMAVRVKHFNASEFDIRYPNQAESNTSVGKIIRNALGKFVSEKPNMNNLVDAYRMLNKFLYLRNIRFFPKEDAGSYKLEILDKVTNDRTTITISENGVVADKDTVIEAIVSTLYKSNTPMQISIRNIDNALLKSVISSNILSSNILQAKPVSGWFTVNPLDANGKEIVAKQVKVPKIVSQNNPVGGRESVIPGTKVTVENTTYYVDIDKDDIRNSEGVLLNLGLGTNGDIIRATAITQEIYGDATEGPDIIDNKVLFPGGAVFDRTTQKFLEGEEAQKVRDALNPQSFNINNNIENKTASDIRRDLNIDVLLGRRTINNSDSKIEGSINLNNLPDSATQIDSHGIAKGNEIEHLLDFLNNGIDKSRTLYTAPLHTNEKTRAAASALGTAGGTSYRDGLFIIAAHPGETLNENGIGTVLINDMSYNEVGSLGYTTAKNLKNYLQKLYPNIDFILYSEAKDYYESNKQTETTARNNSINNEIDSNMSDGIEETINNDDDLFLRKTDEGDYTLWDQEKELAWLDKVLPNMSTEARVKITKGLINVANSGATAFGMVSNGIMTLSDVAVEGTTYHEAFHVVFNYLLNEKEQNGLYEEAKEKWGDLSRKELQENMAEAFREYMLSREAPNLGRRIVNFFKDLLVKVLNWGKVNPSMNAYFRMITEGKFANKPISKQEFVKENREVVFKELDRGMQTELNNKGITQEYFDKMSNEEKEHIKKCIHL